MDEGKMQEHVASQMSPHPYRCHFLHWSKGCPKPFPRLRPRPTQRGKVLPGGPTWCFLQPPHRQRPDDFYPKYPRTKSRDCCSWGIWACFSDKRGAASGDPGCLLGRERDRLPSSDASAVRSPCLCSPGPGKLKPASRRSPFKTSRGFPWWLSGK